MAEQCLTRALNYSYLALYSHSSGQNQEALKYVKVTCQNYNSALDHVKKGSKDAENIASNLKRYLLIYDCIKAGKDALNQQTKIIYQSSLIDSYRFYPWTQDPYPDEFEQRELYTDPDGFLKLSTLQSKSFSQWKRSTQILQELVDSTIFDKKVQMICQSSIQDCSVVASLMSILYLERRANLSLLLPNIFPRDANGPIPSKSGKYMIKLRLNGALRSVVIDDYLPCSKDGSLLFAATPPTKVLWPALLEKAYMKVMGGYDFEGSHAAIDTFVFSTWIPEYIPLDSYLEEPSNSRDKLWNRLHLGWQNNDLMICIGTGHISDAERAVIGLIPDHDYAVIDIEEQNGERLMLVKNPWYRPEGSKEPVFIENSPDVGLGSFWINLDVLFARFKGLYLNWNPHLFAYQVSDHFDWPIESVRECQNSKFLGNSPQFILRNSGREDCFTVLLLNRHISGRSDFAGFFNVTIYNCYNKAYISEDAEVVFKGVDMNTTYSTIRLTIPAHKSYLVVVHGTEQESKIDRLRFTMTVYSERPVELSPASDSLSTSMIKGQWTNELSGGNWSNIFYRDNPQFKLSMTKKASRLRLYLFSEINEPLNVQLFWSGGKQIKAYSERDVICSSGKYRSGYCFTQVDDLDAGTYTIVPSTFEQTIGPFRLYAVSSVPTLITPLISDVFGLFKRSITREWDGNNRVEIDFSLDGPSKAQIHLHTDNSSSASFSSSNSKIYRPHLRLSIFDGSNLIASSEEFSDSVYGVYLESIDLQAKTTYVALIERMESGYGSFSLHIYTEFPVDFY